MINGLNANIINTHFFCEHFSKLEENHLPPKNIYFFIAFYKKCSINIYKKCTDFGNTLKDILRLEHVNVTISFY